MDNNLKWDNRNLSMLFDYYEATMCNGYCKAGMKNKVAIFDMFFRTIPAKGGYVLMAGLEQVVRYLTNLHFTPDDIAYFRSKQYFDEEFISFLETFKFTCDVHSVPEGYPIFPNEPIISVHGPIAQAQIVETMILLSINHQSLIATKASRICKAAQNRPIMEFGARRAQGYDAALYGGRASFIGGCSSTSCAYTDLIFKVPAIGTMAHSWIQSFDSEYESFKAWAKIYPSTCVLLVDTYDVIHSGMKNAIKVFNEVLVPKGFRPKGIRLDSGDLLQLSKDCRKLLDEAGFSDCTIVASNSLDEYAIEELLAQGACLDSFGVGERLITSSKEPVLGGVYKLSAIEGKEGKMIPKIKRSETEAKITNPGHKIIYRVYSAETHQAIADVIGLYGEEVNIEEEIEKIGIKEKFYSKELLRQIFNKGQLVYSLPSVQDIHVKAKEELGKLSKGLLELKATETYPIILSKGLSELKKKLLSQLE